MMCEVYFPPGWDVERVRRVLDYYESLSELDQVAEDEAAVQKEAGDQDSN